MSDVSPGYGRKRTSITPWFGKISDEICAAPFRGEFRFAEGKLVKAWLARQKFAPRGPVFPILLTPYRDTARRGITQG